MNHKRACITPAVLNGKIYVAGGFGSDGTSMERYDPETNKWTILTPMKQRRRYCTVHKFYENYQFFERDIFKLIFKYLSSSVKTYFMVSAGSLR